MARTIQSLPAGRPIRVTLEDGSEVSYTMRGLANDDEVREWADFCASVFAYKANPPTAAYFARHYFSDPHRAADLIRVMIFHSKIDGSSSIVASCRVFQRTLSTGGCKINDNTRTLRAGGIGEVCTDPAHRRRGLSKLLLEDAITIMKERNKQVSLLHAAPAFFPVYQSVGYTTSLSRWSAVPLSMDSTQDKPSADTASIRQAKFPKDTPQLQRLHQQFTESRVAGSIVRSEIYWNEYLRQELKGSLWVLENQNEIVAWLSIRLRGDDRFQLREFGCDRNAEMARPSYAKSFQRLLGRALEAIMDGQDSPTSPPQLLIPTFCLNEIREDQDNNGFLDWSSEVSEDDHGWMYKNLGEDISINLPEVSQTHPLLLWPSDSF